MKAEDVVLWGIPGVIVALLVFVGWIVYREESSEKIELAKADWKCTEQRTSTYFQTITAGKTTTIVPVTQLVCVTYVRR